MDTGSFFPNYFSLEDIIASQIKVPCKTQIDLPNFGFLEPALNNEHLPSGVELELPLWAANVMGKPGRRYVAATMPKKYKESYRAVLRADASVCDLNKMGPHFYQSGLHLASLPSPESEQLSEILPTVLQKRLESMSDSHSFQTLLHTADEATSVKKGLVMKEAHMDALETRIFQDARKGSELMRQYLEKQRF